MFYMRIKLLSYRCNVFAFISVFTYVLLYELLSLLILTMFSRIMFIQILLILRNISNFIQDAADLSEGGLEL